MPDEPEVMGLLALMLLIESRRATRTTRDGEILQPYDQLWSLDPSPVVALNRAVAVAEVHGPGAALAYEAAIARTENATERDFLKRSTQALT